MKGRIKEKKGKWKGMRVKRRIKEKGGGMKETYLEVQYKTSTRQAVAQQSVTDGHLHSGMPKPSKQKTVVIALLAESMNISDKGTESECFRHSS